MPRPHLSVPVLPFPFSSSRYRPRQARRDPRWPFSPSASPRFPSPSFKPPRDLFAPSSPTPQPPQTLALLPRSVSPHRPSAPPCTRRSGAPQLRPRLAAAPPRHQEASRNFCPRPRPLPWPDFQRGPSPVKCSAATFPRRWQSPDHPNPRSTFAGAPRVDPW
jgi:hypothetical protein